LDYEETFLRNGKITVKEEIGASFNDDLKDLPYGRATSI
jgi:hypothetical protein